AYIELHRAYRQTHERLASLDEALGREDTRLQPSPWEEVRDFFHYCDNYIDAVDRAAESFAQRAGPDIRAGTLRHLVASGVSVALAETGRLRSYDAENHELRLSARTAPSTQLFQMLL